MTNTQKALTNYIVNGQQREADGGVQKNQGGYLKIKICGDCGGKVVFVQSTKTGKFYLADVFEYNSGNFFYSKGHPHFKSRQTEQMGLKLTELDIELQALDKSRLAAVDRIIQEQENNPSNYDVRAMLDEATGDIKAKMELIKVQMAELRAAGATL